MDKKKEPLKEVPEKVYDKHHGVMYIRGKFLGKGGFARCYELTNSKNNEMYAGKIVSKTLLVKSFQREKMTQEVQIHKPLSHPHVVKLFHCFEDSDNVYITLELCPRRSLMELHKRRRSVTEPEARYFTHHVCLAIDYLHDKKIIHRDLKLGNLFLNEELQVKIGDFGLATIANDGERKKTLCGTPNYIAPEVLDKKGHSFEVDIWAVGCILYTLLFGKPPFETQSLKDTYKRIQNNQYKIPATASESSAVLIKSLLAADPSRRPTVKEVLRHHFFTAGFLPKRLPVSCLSMAPKFTRDEIRGLDSPLASKFSANSPSKVLSPRQIVRNDLAAGARMLNTVPENNAMDIVKEVQQASGDCVPKDYYINELHTQLTKLLASRPTQTDLSREDEAPEATPIFWVSKWVDYSDKYGIGYQLCDNSVGVLFNDNSKLVLDEAGNELTYTEKNDLEHYYSMEQFPSELNKKITLLKYFRSYMNEHLIKAGANITKKDGDDLARLPVLRQWFRTRSAIVLFLSNGTLQINYFEDHTKVVICPMMSAVTFIDEQKNFHVYKLSHLKENGCSAILANKLEYSKIMTERLLSSAQGSRSSTAQRSSNPSRISALAK